MGKNIENTLSSAAEELPEEIMNAFSDWLKDQKRELGDKNFYTAALITFIAAALAWNISTSILSKKGE